jgi:hypothetical protein
MPAGGGLPEERIQQLIEEIAPLNNLYRQAAKEGRPFYESLGYLWDIGDILLQAGVDRITPVASAIHSSSYITGQLVSYSFRIRKYFPRRGTIKRRFGRVTSYAAFRDAFPLLENKKYRLSRAEERELVRLLNSGAESRKVREEIAAIKRTKAPERKKRDLRLSEMDPFVRMFKGRFDALTSLMEEGSRKSMKRLAGELGSEVLLFVNRLCLSLADEGFAPPETMPPLDDIDPLWREFIREMHLIASGDRTKRNKARRRIKPMDFVTMGNYMDILRDEKKIEKYGSSP